MPDTIVWMGLDSCLRDLGSTYLRSQDFDDYPVVGVSIIQAENYSRWRRDRVLEMLLVSNKILPFTPKFQIDKIFTADEYFSNGYLKFNSKDTIKYYFEFLSPTVEEWYISNAFQDSLKLLLSCSDQESIFYNMNIDWCTNPNMPCVPVYWGCSDK